jgi:transcriptional regulator with XRE-family HTH domain
MNGLRRVRLSRDLRQYELANLSGISQPRISLIENNYVAATIPERECLAKALDCLIEELWGPDPMAGSARKREI